MPLPYVPSNPMTLIDLAVILAHIAFVASVAFMIGRWSRSKPKTITLAELAGQPPGSVGIVTWHEAVSVELRRCEDAHRIRKLEWLVEANEATITELARQVKELEANANVRTLYVPPDMKAMTDELLSKDRENAYLRQNLQKSEDEKAQVRKAYRNLLGSRLTDIPMALVPKEELDAAMAKIKEMEGGKP